jgi:hypothetical protein
MLLHSVNAYIYAGAGAAPTCANLRCPARTCPDIGAIPGPAYPASGPGVPGF